MDELKTKLIKKLKLSPDQFSQVREEQDKTGKSVFSILIKLGLISEEELYIFFGQNFNIPYVRPADYILDEKIIKLFPEELYREHLFLPIFKIENCLYICMANPLDAEFMNMIEMRMGSDIYILFSSPFLIEREINKLFGPDEKNFYLDNLSSSPNRLNMLPFWRESQRLSVELPLEITVQDKRINLSYASYFSAIAVDISYSGEALGVKIDIFIPQGVKVKVKFITQPFYEITGDVVRCNLEQDGSYWVGIKIIDLEGDFKKKILQFVKNNMNENR